MAKEEGLKCRCWVFSIREGIRQETENEAVIRQAIAFVAVSFLFACRHGPLGVVDSSLTQEVLATDDARIAAATTSDALARIYATSLG
jgi:hypothetical protein